VKTVVLGAGALGSILAAHLAHAGEDVALIARGPRAKLLAARGVTVKGLADFTVNVPIIERPQELGVCDVFILTAKTYDTQPALDGVRNLKPDIAMSVQNGVVKNEHLAAVFGWDHTAGCIANFSGEVTGDGSVLFTRNSGLYFGELPRGTSPRMEAFAKVLNDTGVQAVASDHIQSVEWSKYVAWLGLTAVAVLSRLYTHIVYQDEDLASLQAALIREAAALAAKTGVGLVDLGGTLMPETLARVSPLEAKQLIQESGAAMQSQGIVTHRMSALQDLLRGRRLEVEETYGYAVARGAELGVPMPGLETCYRLLAGINRNAGSA